MTDPTSLEKLRRCGRLETYSTIRHHLNFYTNVGTAATYFPPTSSSLPLRTLIFAALRQVITTHSILSAIPLNEDSNYPDPYFARLPSIDLRTCVEFVERKTAHPGDGDADVELETLLSEQHGRNFKEGLGTRPFWRLVILTAPGAKGGEFTAAWFVHHALADGTSGLVFHRALLAALQSASAPSSSDEADAIVASPSTPLLPPIESLHPLPISLFFLGQQLWGEWFPAPVAKLWTGGPITAPRPPSSNARTHIKTLVLSKSQTAQLVALSRANRTTVTAALQTVIASAVLANLDANKFDKVQGDGALSLRPNLTLEGRDVGEEIGVWVSRWVHPFSRQPASPASTSYGGALASFSWESARAVRESITREVAGNGKNSVVGLLRWVSDLQQFFTKRIGMARSESFEISSLGVLKIKGNEMEGDEVWKIGRTIFSQCGSVAGAGFSVSVVTGGDGNLNMAFSWLESAVEEELMGKVVRSVKEGVDEILTVVM
ncbi:hypothetical protein K505DRAFT_362559 [Melanomma pulvis-pyrius CBS 109.77]|uniref:Alcohol acetyltransferase n=1 Tax=Melanomma pulvis-pyrius CBS 109.77 TaxID=1314802 RepID=A0A6A6X8H2_9PLEO|nr:hypothetical protein K505DRAFT_362559 [Melanomma pulvis-pyrius CBS 109.77]